MALNAVCSFGQAFMKSVSVPGIDYLPGQTCGQDLTLLEWLTDHRGNGQVNGKSSS